MEKENQIPEKTIGERLREYRNKVGPEAMIAACDISSSYSQYLISGGECKRPKVRIKVLRGLEKAGF